jgi:hypothetical protein
MEITQIISSLFILDFTIFEQKRHLAIISFMVALGRK